MNNYPRKDRFISGRYKIRELDGSYSIVTVEACWETPTSLYRTVLVTYENGARSLMDEVYWRELEPSVA